LKRIVQLRRTQNFTVLAIFGHMREKTKEELIKKVPKKSGKIIL
jgi:hypothetical protein